MSRRSVCESEDVAMQDLTPGSPQGRPGDRARASIGSDLPRVARPARRSGAISFGGTRTMQRGTKRLRLDGSWHCRIDAGANGG
jgi:hypothetical protein